MTDQVRRLAPATLEFIGTATTVLRLGPFTLLTDPNFLHRGQRAYLGKGLFSRRLTEPSMQPDQLPALDAIVLSHLHGDHFDRVSRAELVRDVPLVTTPAAARRLGRWGFSETLGLQSWQSTTLESGDATLRITAAPGQHAPGPARPLLPPVMGSVLELDGATTRPFRAYITGDTLFRPWLREVVEHHGPIDAMIIHLGGTRILGLLVTMDGDQGAELVELLDPAVTIPIHYDDYTVFRSPLSAFVRRCRDLSLRAQVREVFRGETVSLL